MGVEPTVSSNTANRRFSRRRSVYPRCWRFTVRLPPRILVDRAGFSPASSGVNADKSRWGNPRTHPPRCYYNPATGVLVELAAQVLLLQSLASASFSPVGKRARAPLTGNQTHSTSIEEWLGAFAPCRRILVDPEGVAPSTRQCHCRVILLHHGPLSSGALLLHHGGVASFRMSALRRDLHPRLRTILVGVPGYAPGSPRFQRGAITRSAEPPNIGSHTRIRTWNLHIQSVASYRLDDVGVQRAALTWRSPFGCSPRPSRNSTARSCGRRDGTPIHAARGKC